MKYISNFDEFEKGSEPDKSSNQVLEFNSFHKDYIITAQKDFTVSYEVELQSRSQTTDLQDLREAFERVFKRVIDKYDMDIDYDSSLIDSSYFTGIEMMPFEYFDGINTAFEFLDDFFLIYDKQKQFSFSKNTGFHINIGNKNATEWNLVKGYLLLNDDFSYSGFEYRKNNRFAESFKKEFKIKATNTLRRLYPDVDSKFYNNNIELFEPILNKVIMDIAKNKGEKSIGFNINKLSQNYVEFRYPGGKLSKETIKNQTINYSNIVLAMTNKEYRKNDYIRKMLKFLGEVFGNTEVK